MDSTRFAYTPRPDATPDAEPTALAAVYAFILECYAKKDKAAEASGGEEAGKGEKNVPDARSIR